MEGNMTNSKAILVGFAMVSMAIIISPLARTVIVSPANAQSNEHFVTYMGWIVENLGWINDSLTGIDGSITYVGNEISNCGG